MILTAGRMIRGFAARSDFTQICLDISKTVELCNAPLTVSKMRKILSTSKTASTAGEQASHSTHSKEAKSTLLSQPEVVASSVA